MSYPKLLNQKFQNRECRGRSLLPGFGVTPNYSFYSFYTPSQAARGEERMCGEHPTPRQRADRPLQSCLSSRLKGIELLFEKFGVTHGGRKEIERGHPAPRSRAGRPWQSRFSSYCKVVERTFEKCGMTHGSCAKRRRREESELQSPCEGFPCKVRQAVSKEKKSTPVL
jgi:hypothetical protein